MHRLSTSVLLGAGLDSLAWRRPDLLRSVKIFEVDHPVSQSWKRQRMTDLALLVSEGHPETLLKRDGSVSRPPAVHGRGPDRGNAG
jgi:Leucine carboxyl methyltransferase